MTTQMQSIVDVLTEAASNVDADDSRENGGLTNAERADRAEEGAEAYRVVAGFTRGLDVEHEAILKDLVNDLCHAARERGMDVEEMLASAYLSFRVEVENEANVCDCDGNGAGWLHMNDSMGRGPGIEACDECGKYDTDEEAQAAHDAECTTANCNLRKAPKET